MQPCMRAPDTPSHPQIEPAPSIRHTGVTRGRAAAKARAAGKGVRAQHACVDGVRAGPGRLRGAQLLLTSGNEQVQSIEQSHSWPLSEIAASAEQIVLRKRTPHPAGLTQSTTRMLFQRACPPHARCNRPEIPVALISWPLRKAEEIVDANGVQRRPIRAPHFRVSVEGRCCARTTWASRASSRRRGPGSQVRLYIEQPQPRENGGGAACV